MSTGNGSIKIAFLDTGLDPYHPELPASTKAVSGWNIQRNNSNTTDVQGHGTAMAGAAAGLTNNTIGIAGVCPLCKVMPISVNDTLHPTWIAPADAASGLYKAVELDADVINMSLVFDYTDLDHDTINHPLRAAVAYGAQFAVLTACMGNSDVATMVWPAKFDSTIAVGGTQNLSDCKWERIESHCNPPDPIQTGDLCACLGSNYGSHIDVVAPAWPITSTDLTAIGGYDILSCGTSYSTAIVSGLAGLILSQSQALGLGLSPLQVKEVIEKSAEDTLCPASVSMNYPDQLGWDPFYGWGRVNAYRALVAISRGDVNNDKAINQLDVNYLISYFSGGPPPIPHKGLGDVNNTGTITYSDLIYLYNFVNNGGPRPLLCYKYDY